MKSEYKIEIFMTPHTWDNPKNPYFWVILKSKNNNWVNTGHCGWAKTPEKAWSVAIEEYKILS